MSTFQPSTPQPASTSTAPRPRVRPRTDVLETPEALILVADVPGVDATSIELELVEDVLTLRASPAVRAPEGWAPAGSEFDLPDYERSFRLHADVDREAPAASVQNGRLKVVLRKRLPRASRIPVQGS